MKVPAGGEYAHLRVDLLAEVLSANERMVAAKFKDFAVDMLFVVWINFANLV